MQRHDKLISFAVDKLTANPVVKNIYLFGSCSRGDEAWSSDVDLFVVVDDAATNREIRLLSCEAVPEEFECPELDVCVYRESSLRNDTFFHQQVKKDWRQLK